MCIFYVYIYYLDMHITQAAPLDTFERIYHGAPCSAGRSNDAGRMEKAV